jgi:hypothetical protein
VVPLGFEFLETGKLDSGFDVEVLLLEILNFLPESSDDCSEGRVCGSDLVSVGIASTRFELRVIAIDGFLQTLVFLL